MGRVDRQITWSKLPNKWKKHATLVCPINEVNAHAQRGRHVVGCPVHGIAPTRDWIVDYANENGVSRILMMDDDITLQRAGDKIIDCTDKEAGEALTWMDNVLKKYAHASMMPRFLNPLVRGEQYNMRAMYALGYNLTRLGDRRFTRSGPTDTMEDFYMTLQLLTSGYDNVVHATHRVNPGPSNAPGGCSTWRTTPGQTDSARALHEIWPDVVRLREKKQWQGMEEGMLDVTIYWKKARKAAP
jgi:hypothetical protein